MAEKAAGTITLESSSVAKGEKLREFLSVRFEPPLPQGTGYRKAKDGHFPVKVIQNKQGETEGVIYDRGIFGWAPGEREEAFVKYWQKQGSRLGYTLAEDTVLHPDETPIEIARL